MRAGKDKINLDIYDLLNDAEMDLAEYEVVEPDVFTKERHVSELKKIIHLSKSPQANWRYRLNAVAILCVGMVLLSFFTFKLAPAFATNIPVVGSIIKNITGYGNDVFDDYTEIIGKTAEAEGIEITLNEVVLDENQLRLAITVKGLSESNHEYGSVMTPQVAINGRVINPSGSSGIGEFKEDGQFVCVATFDINQIKLPKENHVTVSYFPTDSEGKPLWQSSEKNPWEFQFQVSKRSIAAKTETYRIDRSVTYNQVVMKLEDMTITPLTTSIRFKFKGDRPLSFIIKDQSGKELKPETMGYGTGSLLNRLWGYNEGDFAYSGVGDESKRLTLIPYVEQLNRESEKTIGEKALKELKAFDGKLPLILEQTGDNRLIVEEVTLKDGVIYVSYRSEGISSELQKYRLYLYDESLNQVERDYENSKMDTLGTSEDLFIAAFKEPESGIFYLGTDRMDEVTVLEDQKIEIRLKR